MRIPKPAVVLVTTLLILLSLVPITNASELYGNLNYKVENVYYEGDTLVVFGYWLNETNKYILSTNWVKMNVYTWNGSFWEIIASGSFTASDYLHIAPGKSKYWTYKIYDSPRKSLNRWWVQTQVNFNWRNPSADM